MEWIELFIAGILEIFWAISLKYSQGFTKLIPSVVTVIGMAVGFFFLALATKKISIGTAYAIWTGIGAVGTVICGIFLFHEPVSIPKILFLLMITAGIVGIKIIS